MNSNDSKNVLIAFILSILVLVSWNYFFPPQHNNITMQKSRQDDLNSSNNQQPLTHNSSQINVKDTPGVDTININSPTIKGSIQSLGCRFDDITLKNYTEKPDHHGNNIKILSSDHDSYYTEFGWTASDKSIRLPDSNTHWQVSNQSLKEGHFEIKPMLTPDHPIILKWDNGQGLTFTRIISLDKEYVFKIEDQILNTSRHTRSLAAYGLIARGLPENLGNFFILHEGPIGYLGKKLIELKYSDFDKNKLHHFESQGGWLGITDKYWLTALIPDQSKIISVNYRESTHDNIRRYQTDYSTGYLTIGAGQTLTYSHHLYVGVKKLEILDAYENRLNIPHFDLAVDFGWFYFLTKPIFYFLTWLGSYIGNFGVAILIFTLILKLIMFPLANKSYRSMARMRDLQPKIELLKSQCGDDRMKLNQEMIKLYKREKINPASGCLPMILQIPVFFALYKVLFVTIEMRHAPFFGWIHDLCAPDPTTIFNLFGLLPFTPPSFLMIGAWPLIMGLTMFIQQRLTPAPADPTQAKVMMLLPIIFTFTLAQFPAGLVIYWAWNNILTIIQQSTIMKWEKQRSNLKRA